MILAWTGFTFFIFLLLAADLLLVNRKSHVIRAREALMWTAFYVTLALAFSAMVYFAYGNHWLGLGLPHPDGHAGISGREAVFQYLTGWMVEYALSMDNIFVISIILLHFKTPPEQQHRVLFWGVLGAIVMRGAMILAGTALIHAFAWMIYLFGMVLLLTALRLLIIKEEIDLEKNMIIRIARRYFRFTGEYEGARFFTRQNGKLLGTPLLLVMIVVQTTDALFAFDSIPAIFAITNDSFLIYSSNMFAILGLRSLYFALAAVIAQFRYLKLSLVFVLGFIGIKMMLHSIWHPPTWVPLTVVASLFATGVLASVWVNQAEKRRRLRPIDDIALAAEYAWKRSRRVVIAIIGVTILLIAIPVGLIPGPGGIFVFLGGLALLATEFIWARILLGKLKKKAMELKNAASKFTGIGNSPRSAADAVDPAAPPVVERQHFGRR